jgi:methionyl-tRNA formyltransferase
MMIPTKDLTRMSYKVLFCGTPEFARSQLEYLIRDSEFEVVTVVSQPDRPAGRGHKFMPSPVKDFALRNNIPVLTPEKASDPDFINELKKQQYDICVVVAYGQILKKNFLDLFSNKCVNLHGSLLPRWRGAAPIQRALMEGDKETGICLQVVVSKLDAGPVIGERVLPLTLEDTATDVFPRLAQMGAELLVQDLKKYIQGHIQPRVQDESQVTYAHKIEKSESEIQWTDSATLNHNKIRGLSMGPQANCVFQGKRLKLIKTMPLSKNGKPGEVLEAHDDTLVVACKEGALQLLVVQPESKKPMLASEFLRGYKVEKGALFANQ